jgi:hypothetical protein
MAKIDIRTRHRHEFLDEVGFGLTAFSSPRDRLLLNTQNFGEYYQAIEEGRLPSNRSLVRDLGQQISWAIVASARLNPAKVVVSLPGFLPAQTSCHVNPAFVSRRSQN